MIKYKFGGNVVNYFGKNVFLLIVFFLGLEWMWVLLKFIRCLSLIFVIFSIKEEGIEEVGIMEVGIMLDIFVVLERIVLNIVNFIGFFVFVMLIF